MIFPFSFFLFLCPFPLRLLLQVLERSILGYSLRRKVFAYRRIVCVAWIDFYELMTRF